VDSLTFCPRCILLLFFLTLGTFIIIIIIIIIMGRSLPCFHAGSVDAFAGNWQLLSVGKLSAPTFLTHDIAARTKIFENWYKSAPVDEQ